MADAARGAAGRDYGQSIKDLAASNIFPGDILTKNFGVTRHGRVVFYDYDELTFLTDCNFRDLPQATTYEEEMSASHGSRCARTIFFRKSFHASSVCPNRRALPS